jgi:hypothetical protein
MLQIWNDFTTLQRECSHYLIPTSLICPRQSAEKEELPPKRFEQVSFSSSGFWSLLPHYVGPCTERQHYLNLAQLVEFGTGALPGSLRDGRYRYGVAQKLLNLALKYHWCLGQISEPPHCPIDRIIIEKTHLRGQVNRTEIVDEEQYRAVIEAVRRKAEPESIARWELLNYRCRSSP